MLNRLLAGVGLLFFVIVASTTIPLVSSFLTTSFRPRHTHSTASRRRRSTSPQNNLIHRPSSHTLTKMIFGPNNNDEDVILVVGSCGLDRLLTVDKYPDPDAKVRTEAYHEVGGGNAANTASAMALLANAACFNESNGSSSRRRNNKSSRPVKIKLLTKIGDDTVGQVVSKELQDSGVDLSSPLFRVGDVGTTTAFTTILVSRTECTRTCIHTPGTCGELTLDDVSDVNMDKVFANVIHLHSDCRHTDVALRLAEEAQKRNIPISVDAEKDRTIASMDGLLEKATTLFTNSHQLQSYFERRMEELEIPKKRIFPIAQKEEKKGPNGDNSSSSSSKNDGAALPPEDMLSQMYIDAIGPSSFFAQHYRQFPGEKDVVITKGSLGALHVVHQIPIPLILEEDKETAMRADSEGIHVAYRSPDSEYSSEYLIQTTGVLDDVHVVDTTGAGDAFIGGYILGRRMMMTSISDSDGTKEESETTKSGVGVALKLGAWVGGRKLEGPGSRLGLPKGSDVDECLGHTLEEVVTSLNSKIGTFGRKKEAAEKEEAITTPS